MGFYLLLKEKRKQKGYVVIKSDQLVILDWDFIKKDFNGLDFSDRWFNWLTVSHHSLF